MTPGLTQADKNLMRSHQASSLELYMRSLQSPTMSTISQARGISPRHSHQGIVFSQLALQGVYQNVLGFKFALGVYDYFSKYKDKNRLHLNSLYLQRRLHSIK